MFYIVKYVYGMIENVFNTHKDVRVQHLPLIGNIAPVFGIIGLYLAFVLYYGPKWMEKRKPYNLKHIMQFYNVIQVAANLYLFITGLQNSYLRREFSFTCQPVDDKNTQPWMMRLLNITYGYYITKYLDLFDTIFIVLRKKYKQITFLHVYHHAGMVFAVFIYMTFMPGSHSTMLGVINLLVHTVMYTYYFVTSLRPSKRMLWWKRYITQMQLMQFGYLMVHFTLVIVNNTCQHPKLISFVGLIQNVFMFVMFFDFYYKAYLRKTPTNALPQSKEHQQSTAQLNGTHMRLKMNHQVTPLVGKSTHSS